MTDEERIIRGRQAAAELSQLQGAFQALRDETIQAWINSSDPAERERLHARIAALDEAERRLKSTVAAAKVAERPN